MDSHMRPMRRQEKDAWLDVSFRVSRNGNKMNPYFYTALYLLSVSLCGYLCWKSGRKHRDKEWKEAVLWEPEKTQTYCHGIIDDLPQKP